MGRLAGVILLVLLALMLPACGGAQQPASGIYGVTVVNQGGRIGHSTILPGGFGRTDRLDPDPTSAVRITVLEGDEAGTIVASVRSDDQAIFRVPLAPGAYRVSGAAMPDFAQTISIRPGEFARVVLRTGVRF